MLQIFSRNSYLLITVSVLVLLAVVVASTSTGDSCGVGRSQEVKSIATSITNSLSSYRLEENNIDDLSTEGGVQKTFYSGDKKVYVTQEFFGETGKSEVSYFFVNNSIGLIDKVNYEYEKPLSEDASGTIINTSTKEFIFDKNGNLCAYNEDGIGQEITTDTLDLTNFLLNSVTAK